MMDRQERAAAKVAHIDQQIKAIASAQATGTVQGVRMGSQAEAIEFQVWRKRVLEHCVGKPDRVLKARITALRKRIDKELWDVRYSADLSEIDEVQKKAICEVFLLEYLLGTYPEGGS